MGMVFNFLDRIAANKKMPLKLRFFADNLQRKMSPEAQQVDALLSEDRVDEASAIASAMPDSHLSHCLTAGVAGARARLRDQQIRAEHAAQSQAEEVAEARAALRNAAEEDLETGLAGVSGDLRKRRTYSAPLPDVADDQEPQR